MRTPSNGKKRLIVACVVSFVMSGLFGAGPASAVTTPVTMSDVKAAIVAGQPLTAPERHLLATKAAKVMNADPVLIERIITLQPKAALALPVSTSSVTSSSSLTAAPTFLAAASCSGSSRRTSTRYSYNATGAKVWRYSLTKNWSWNKCAHRVYDGDFMSSDDISGYVYGPFQWAWNYGGTTSHSGHYYTFNGYANGGHQSLARGKFDYCISVPFIGSVCLQRQNPWVKVNAHYNGSSATYSG